MCTDSIKDLSYARMPDTMDFVKSMGIGINLGNTLEARPKVPGNYTVSDYETAWYSPIITEDMIKGYLRLGFDSVRVPVTWSNMMSEDYTISPDYIARAKEIIGWILKNGMKAIVNIHHEDRWFKNFPADEPECMKKYTRIWEQVAEAFKDYPLDLMFESLNEEACWNDLWDRTGKHGDNGKPEAYALLGRINQKFVDTVRSSGGNNPQRHLLIAGYCTDIVQTCDELFWLPIDPAERYAVSMHYYTPPEFAIISKDAPWGKARADWGSEADYNQLNGLMDMMYERFVKNGIPVIMGEYGCTRANKARETVREYLTSVCRAVYTRGACPMLWDTPGGFYDRKTQTFGDMDIISGFAEIKKLERK